VTNLESGFAILAEFHPAARLAHQWSPEGMSPKLFVFVLADGSAGLLDRRINSFPRVCGFFRLGAVAKTSHCCSSGREGGKQEFPAFATRSFNSPQPFA
jgi:hypothetical protein